MNPVYVLGREFFSICILDKGPQDLPTSQTLFQVVLALHVIISGVLSGMRLGLGYGLFVAIVEALLFALVIYVMLYSMQLASRFLQTMTALFGCGTLLELLSAPFVLMLVSAQQSEADTSLPAILVLVMLFWVWTVYAHIIRHALDTSLFIGVFVVFMFSTFVGMTMMLLIPGLATGAGS